MNDPCCPSADVYGEYRNKDQIERQSKEVTELQKQQHKHVVKHVTATTAATREQQSAASGAPAASSYNIRQPLWYYRDNTLGAIQGLFAGRQMVG